jgi:hypothetical protein
MERDAGERPPEPLGRNAEDTAGLPDVAALRQEIRRRREARQRREADQGSPADGPAAVAGRRSMALLRCLKVRRDLQQVEDRLQEAERFATVGLAVPAVQRCRGPVALVLRLARRVVRSLANFITHEQRQFNLQLQECVRALHGAVLQLEALQRQAVGEGGGRDTEPERWRACG